jgi:hypothetical protein
MTLEDRRRMAAVLGMPTRDFTRKFCVQEDGIWKLKDEPGGDCTFLKNKRCSVYEGRPTQCRTWPFWPEAMNAKTWTNEIASFCPGVGKGKVWSAEEVEIQLKDQQQSQNRYGS